MSELNDATSGNARQGEIGCRCPESKHGGFDGHERNSWTHGWRLREEKAEPAGGFLSADIINFRESGERLAAAGGHKEGWLPAVRRASGPPTWCHAGWRCSTAGSQPLLARRRAPPTTFAILIKRLTLRAAVP